MQQHAERVYVGSGGDGSTANQLRTGIERRQLAGTGRLGRLGGFRLRESARDAEVHEHHATIGRHENVGRLEVAVHDEIPMRVLHRGADVAEQVQPRLDGQPAIVAVAVDVLAVDVLHREPGEPVGGDAAVEQPRDSGVVEAGEDLPLVEEPLKSTSVVPSPSRQHLERDVLAVLIVRPAGEIHGSHPARSQLATNAVRPERRHRRVRVLTVERRVTEHRVVEEGRGECRRGAVERRCLFSAVDQGLQLGSHGGMIGETAPHERALLLRLELEREVGGLEHVAPELRHRRLALVVIRASDAAIPSPSSSHVAPCAR